MLLDVQGIGACSTFVNSGWLKIFAPQIMGKLSLGLGSVSGTNLHIGRRLHLSTFGVFVISGIQHEVALNCAGSWYSHNNLDYN